MVNLCNALRTVQNTQQMFSKYLLIEGLKMYKSIYALILFVGNFMLTLLLPLVATAFTILSISPKRLESSTVTIQVAAKLIAFFAIKNKAKTATIVSDNNSRTYWALLSHILGIYPLISSLARI